MAIRASPIACKRLFTSRSRHRCNRARMGCGAGTCSNGISLRSTSARVCAIVAASNSGLPFSISHNTTPNDQISARRSTAAPAACSGAMYPGVPRITPASVAPMVSVGELPPAPAARTPDCTAVASPKSKTFTAPSSRTLTLAGFRSRCTTPFSCAASSASAICAAIFRASRRGTAPAARRVARVGPSTSSITR